VACIGTVILKERVIAIREFGLLLVLCGGLMIGGLGIASLGGRQSIGDLLFLSATCMWACYTVATMPLSLTACMRPQSPRFFPC
jgi:drug/metabolite transporter (DMT)-like permease